MALKRLTTEEMVQISGPWVNPASEQRAALQGIAEVAGLLTRVDAAHAALLASQPGVDNPRLAKLMAEAAEVDATHDAHIRVVWNYLTAHADVLTLTDPAKSVVVTKTRDILLPDGLAHTQKSYRGEAGAAELLKKRLSATDADTTAAKALLAELKIGDKTLGSFKDQWVLSAEQLGRLEDERATLAAPQPAPDAPTPGDARNQWIRIVNALEANAALASVSAATDNLIFGALRLAEKSADRRRPSTASADVGTKGQAGQPGPQAGPTT